jgi:hypothetical protein
MSSSIPVPLRGRLTIMGLVLLAIPAAAQQTHTVPVPNLTIQSAVNIAASGDTIIVSPNIGGGPYFENVNLLSLNLTILANPVGGIIVDGSLAAPVFTIAGGQDASTLIDGFVIQHGLGGLVGSTTRGGGILCLDTGPRITNCTIFDNRADEGAGMYTLATSLALSFPQVADTIFTDNIAFVLGGGLLVDSSDGVNEAQFDDCTFFANLAQPMSGPGGDGGGAALRGSSNPTLDHCLFHANVAHQRGGGVWVVDSAQGSFVDCDISGNRADVHGGGVAYDGLRGTAFRHVTIANNLAAAGDGGGVHGVGPEQLRPRFRNVLIKDNDAALEGGAMHVTDSGPLLDWVTSTGNNAGTGATGGIFTQYPLSTGVCISVQRSILWGDTAASLPTNPWDKELAIPLATPCGAPLVTQSDIQGSTGGPWSLVLDADPLFTSDLTGSMCGYAPVDGAFLVQTSPCIDGSGVQASTTLIAGRRTDPAGAADSGRADMGWHYPDTSCP